MRLENKKAIITGAASGFGAGIAKKFIQEGAEVIVADINDNMAVSYTQLRAHETGRKILCRLLL